MPQSPGTYRAPRGVTTGSAGIALIFLLLALIASFSGEEAAGWMFVGGVAVGLWAGLGPLVLRWAGRPALRVDADGILLGRSLRPRLVPWPEVRAVVEFRERSFDYFGVLVSNRGRSRLLRTDIRVPGVDPDTTAISMPLLGWRLDRDALATTVAAHAPQVPVHLGR